jgi:hypothetical protein
MIGRTKISVTPAGESGAATGDTTTSVPINGRLLGVHIDYDADAHANTDVTVATTSAPVTTILTISNNKTDGWYYPLHALHGSTGTAVTYDGTRPVLDYYYLDDYVKVTMGDGTAAKGVVVTLLLET